ncbi:unnamed protein product [Cercospora beticola]|nr:unnamed protein product [Cercospora beticola]
MANQATTVQHSRSKPMTNNENEEFAKGYQTLCIWANGTIKNDASVIDEIITNWFPGASVAETRKRLEDYEDTILRNTYHTALPAVRKLANLKGEDDKSRWLSSTSSQRKKVFLEDPGPILTAIFPDFKVVPLTYLYRDNAPQTERIWRAHAERKFVALCEAIYTSVVARDNSQPLFDGCLMVCEELRQTKLKDTPGGANVSWKDMPALPPNV